MNGYASSNAAQRPLLTVIVPVADLMAEPSGTLFGPGGDCLRLTQVLMNEVLDYLGEQDGWFSVKAREQRKPAHGQDRGGYPGWVRKESVVFIENLPRLNGIITRGTMTRGESRPALTLYLSAGTKVALTGERMGDLTGIHLPGDRKGWIHNAHILESRVHKSPAGKRRQIVETGMSFIGTPYLWGGRSSHPPSLPLHPGTPVSASQNSTGPATGVDCSGLVNLSYRAAGIEIPRDARDQWAAARPVSARDLQPADLIFLSPGEGPGRINHVILFLGKDQFIEAVQTGTFVEVGTFLARFGQTHEGIMKNNFICGSKEIYYGSLLGN